MRLRPLPYQDALTLRDPSSISLVVIHCTELPDLDTARSYGEVIHYSKSQTGNSGHFYIDRDGSTEQWVAPLRVAHHVRGFNENSIGIELVNHGRYPHWLDSRHQAMSEPYPDRQLHALNALLARLCAQIPSIEQIAGHEDLDKERVPASDDRRIQVRRKTDPGPLFPWPEVLEACGLKRLLA